MIECMVQQYPWVRCQCVWREEEKEGRREEEESQRASVSVEWYACMCFW